MKVYDAKIAVTLPDEKILDNFMEIMINNESLRESIAESGYSLVTKEHTYAHRAQQLLNILEG